MVAELKLKTSKFVGFLASIFKLYINIEPSKPIQVHSLAVSLFVSVLVHLCTTSLNNVQSWLFPPCPSVKMFKTLVPRESIIVHPKSKIVNRMTNGPRSKTLVRRKNSGIMHDLVFDRNQSHPCCPAYIKGIERKCSRV